MPHESPFGSPGGPVNRREFAAIRHASCSNVALEVPCAGAGRAGRLAGGLVAPFPKEVALVTPRIRPVVLPIGLLALALSAASPAAAEDVNMKDATAFLTGTAKVKVEGLGTCLGPASLDLTFPKKRRFEGIDIDGKTISGKFKQKGTDGRKLVASLSSKSKKAIVKGAKAIIYDCTGADKVKADGSNFKFKAKVNKDRDMLKVKGTAKLEGSVDGEGGEAKYSVKLIGPLTLMGDVVATDF